MIKVSMGTGTEKVPHALMVESFFFIVSDVLCHDLHQDACPYPCFP